MTSSESQPARKHHRHRNHSDRNVVQYLVLRFSNEFPSLTANLGNIALLKMAAGYGLIAAELAERCRNAYREFRRIQHALRLNGAQYARVPTDQVAAKAEAVRQLWKTVFSAYP